MRKIALVAFLAWAGPALAQVADSGATKAPAAKQRLTPQALWEMKRLGSPQLAPDGRSAVFTVQEWSHREEQEHDQPVARGRGKRGHAPPDRGSRVRRLAALGPGRPAHRLHLEAR